MMTINRKVSGRELRRTLAADGELARAAVVNEELTRQRVDNLESGLTYLASVLGRGFWGRVSWLVRGK